MSVPNPNLILNSAQLDKWIKEGGISVEWDGTEQMFKVSSQIHTSGRWGAYQDIAVEPSTQYTYSLDGMAGNVSCHLAIADGTSWSATRATFTQTRDRLSYTWTTGASATAARVYLCITATQAGKDSGGSYGYFAMPKLELGSEATEWCAHPSEGGWKRMSRYIDSGGLSHLMSKIKAAIAATVTGVKGNAESSYRTGQVNITPANVGAVSLSGNETISGDKTFSGTTTLSKTALVSTPENTFINAQAQGLYQSPIPKYLWHDLFSFCRYSVPTYETTTDGATWTAGTVDKKHFAQLENLSIPWLTSTICGVRLTWQSDSFTYCGAKWIAFGVSYSYPLALYTVKVEFSADGTTWTTQHESQPKINQAPTWLYLKTSPGGTDKRIRLTVTKATTDTGVLNVGAIKLLTSRWGGQGAGSEFEYPYDWDTTPNIVPISNNGSDLGSSSKKWNNVYASDFRGGRFFGGLLSSPQRWTSANITDYGAQLKYSLATSSMTTGKPTSGDGHLISMEWDNNGKWAAQLSVPISDSERVQWRTQGGTDWAKSWHDILDERDKSELVGKSDELLTTNPFAPVSFEGPYISKIDNAFYAADKRWAVTATNLSGGVNPLFDGNYETRSIIEKSQTSVILMDFSNTTYFPGYPYGYILVSFYYTEQPESVSGRVYCNYEPHGIGWHDITFERVADSTTGACVYRSSHQWYYNISKLEITVAAKASNNASITQIEMNLDRPSSQRTPFLSKYAAETLYYNLTAPKFIGALQGNADTASNIAQANRTTVANTLINALTTGASTPSDNDYYVSQYVNGGTSTTTYHRRPMSALWAYINGKISSWMKNLTAKGHLNWTSSTNDTMPVTSNTLAYWNGRYNASSSNLEYCVKGAFGTAAVADLSTSTSSTSTTTAATSSAVKTAYDLANTANGTANTALSGVNGTLIYDHTYTIANGVATFTAHVYCKGEEVTSQYADSAFSWSYRLSDAISETGTPSVVSLGTGKTKTINITTLGLGGHVIGTFTTD